MFIEADIFLLATSARRSASLPFANCRQEQVFEREQVFGRDASSVFPTEGQKAAAEAAEKLKSKLGANRFISETEVRSMCRANFLRGFSKKLGAMLCKPCTQRAVQGLLVFWCRFRSCRKSMEEAQRDQSQSSLWHIFCSKPNRPRMQPSKTSGSR